METLPTTFRIVHAPSSVIALLMLAVFIIELRWWWHVDRLRRMTKAINPVAWRDTDLPANVVDLRPPREVPVEPAAG